MRVKLDFEKFQVGLWTLRFEKSDFVMGWCVSAYFASDRKVLQLRVSLLSTPKLIPIHLRSVNISIIIILIL